MKLNKMVAILMLVVLAFSLTACGGSKSQDIVGKWNIDVNSLLEMTGASPTDLEMIESLGGMSATMEFTKDGKCILEMSVMGQTETQEQTYTLEDGKVLLDGAPGDYKVEGDKLTLTADGLTMVLTRAK